MNQNARTTGAQEPRRLVLCFDGTWNTPEDETNVSRIYAAVKDRQSGYDRQLKFYDPGVGTDWGSRIAGGALGWGLNQNILEGYCWLIDNYCPQPPDATPIVDPGDAEKFENGDQIFLFGFSRGAFTARSLAGLINACGLVKKSPSDGPTATDSDLVKKAWTLYRNRSEVDDVRMYGPCEQFRKDHAHNVKVRFVGVWDTVGALGVPKFGGSLLPTRNWRYGFHDTGLCRIVEHAYHAVAIDEHRRDYAVALWSQAHKVGTKTVEQRWFPGAHANVGGGYEDDLLPELSLRWMCECAYAHGLEFDSRMGPSEEVRQGQAQQGEMESCEAQLGDFRLDGTELMAPVRDSFAEFMFGLYRAGSTVRSLGESAGRGVTRVLRIRASAKTDQGLTGEIGIDGRYYRPMLVKGVGEIIDPSAQKKWARDPRYRPLNLAYAGRNMRTAEDKLDVAAQVSS